MKLPADPDPLEARLARLQPADLPADFHRRLLEAEPVPSTRLRSLRPPALPGGFSSPWSLAYAGLLAAWLLIFALHLATPPAPTAMAYSTAALPSVGSRTTLPVMGGSSVDRATLLATNPAPTANFLQP